MAFIKFKQIANTAFLANKEELVLAGKQGFSTDLGVVPMLCTSYTTDASYITFVLSNLNLAVDSNKNNNIMNLSSFIGQANNFINIPVKQYSNTTNYFNNQAKLSLRVNQANITTNTIKTYKTANVESMLLTPPFYIDIYQPINKAIQSNGFFYVKGYYNIVTVRNNIDSISGSYTSNLPIEISSKNFLKVYLDGLETTNYSISTSTGNTIVSLDLSGSDVELRIDASYYTTPAIEKGDFIAFSTSANNYKVINTSYQPSSALYNAAKTANKIYEIQITPTLAANASGLKIINLSRNLNGFAGNITSNSFTIDYDSNYQYTYTLANSGIYYVYQKNKVALTSARVDEYGRLNGVNPGYYLVDAINVTKTNRISAPTSAILSLEPIKINKVSSISITEQVFIDTTGGASISATISFPPIESDQVSEYEIKYKVISAETSTVPEYSKASVPHVPSTAINYTINNLNRGRTVGSNILDVVVTPKNGTNYGFATKATHYLVGKTTRPSGLTNLNVAQVDNTIVYTWDFQQTADGFIQDLDTKEVEIREYPGSIDVSNQSTLAAAWTVSIPVNRVSFPSTSFIANAIKYGTYTYLLRVRDTSDIESEIIAAAVVEIVRPSIYKVYKAYNEAQPSVGFITQDSIAFPNSNIYAENPFPSFSMASNGGLVKPGASRMDNANASSYNFSTYPDDTDLIYTSNLSRAVYTTQIRDIGKIITGSVKLATDIFITTPNIALNGLYTTVASGVTDANGHTTNLVDSAFMGIGHVLGFSNANAATVSYSATHQTLVSGGTMGNVYAIRNPGQFVNDIANANAISLIAGVINANAIALGRFYYANGKIGPSNAHANIAISGNSYQLVNLAQFGDTEGSLTFLGPDRNLYQNVFLRYATDNVYYSAASNSAAFHGNVIETAFVGASSNAALGFRNFISGDAKMRYFQIKYEVINKKPETCSIVLENFNYTVDIKQKIFTKTLPITSAAGITVDYSSVEFNDPPIVTAALVNSTNAYSISISQVSSTSCNVKVFDYSNTAVTTQNVALTAIGV